MGSRARARAAERTLVSEGASCHSCGGVGGNQHHRKRRSQGGADEAPNILRLCGSGTTGCHGHWHHHIETALQLGYLVSRDDDPARRPLFSLVWGSWVLPLADGNVKLIEPPPGNDARNYTPQESPDV